MTQPVLDPQPQATTLPPMPGGPGHLITRKTGSRSLPARKGSLGGVLGIQLEYDPFQGGPDALKRLLKDLSMAVLEGRLYPRQASTVRSLVGMWLRLSEYEKIPELEQRIAKLEGEKR